MEARVEDLPRERASTTEVEPSGASVGALAEARFDFVQAKFGDPGFVEQAERRYENTRELFERFHGGIIHEYWTSSAPGGVVVTASGRRWPFEARRARFFRFTDYLTNRHPETGELLFAGDALASMCEEVLRGPTQRIALTQVFTAASRLLSSLDAVALSPRAASAVDAPEPSVDVSPEEAERREQRRAEERARRKLEQEQLEQDNERRIRQAGIAYERALAAAERFYGNGASQSAQFYYFIGMLIGAAVAALSAFVLAALVAPLLADLWGLDLKGEDTAAAFAAAAAGSLGAIVSVMWRMTAGTFREDAVFGADNLLRLGAFRPFLGTMFGFILYVALQAGVISNTYVPDDASWYFYIFLAFLAGFSERLVPDFLGNSARTVSRSANTVEAESELRMRGSEPLTTTDRSGGGSDGDPADVRLGVRG